MAALLTKQPGLDDLNLDGLEAGHQINMDLLSNISVPEEQETSVQVVPSCAKRLWRESARTL